MNKKVYFKALKILKKFLKEQKELDSEIKEILYKNLWKLCEKEEK
jgi:hypothetical protein